MCSYNNTENRTKTTATRFTESKRNAIIWSNNLLASTGLPWAGFNGIKATVRCQVLWKLNILELQYFLFQGGLNMTRKFSFINSVYSKLATVQKFKNLTFWELALINISILHPIQTWIHIINYTDKTKFSSTIPSQMQHQFL